MSSFLDVWEAISTGKGNEELANAQNVFEEVCNKRIKKREIMTACIIKFDIAKAELIAKGATDPKFKTTLKNELAIAANPKLYENMMDAINVKKAHDIFLKKWESRINTIKKLLGENIGNFRTTG